MRATPKTSLSQLKTWLTCSHLIITFRLTLGCQSEIDGNDADGYIVYETADPETGIYVSYPKFRTQFGTCISFKNGIWNGTGYEKRLKVINMPVLKSHHCYGVTASLKHFMGVQSEGDFVSGGLANGHATVATGGMGTLMVETGLPTLNIIDSIWINANPSPSTLAGPRTPYDRATRVNVLLASTDPVALDYWAAKHVLMQAANLIGYNDTHTLDPDNTDRSGVDTEAFGVWLTLTKNEIIAGGYNVTTDENHVNVYVCPRAVTREKYVTIDQSGSDAPVTGSIDGESYDLPVSFWWGEDSSHSISVPSTIDDPNTYGKRYTFTQWSGLSSSTSNSIKLTITTNGTLTANYKTKYYITVISDHGSPTPDQWIEEGRNLTVGVTSPAETILGQTRWCCTGYSIDGGQTQPGTSYTFENVQTSRKIEFEWILQYYLTIDTGPTGLSPQPKISIAGPWYDSGTQLTSTAETVNGYVFDHWEVDGTSQGYGVDPIKITMDAPHIVKAHYTTTPPFILWWLASVLAIVAVAIVTLIVIRKKS